MAGIVSSIFCREKIGGERFADVIIGMEKTRSLRKATRRISGNSATRQFRETTYLHLGDRHKQSLVGRATLPHGNLIKATTLIETSSGREDRGWTPMDIVAVSRGRRPCLCAARAQPETKS